MLIHMQHLADIDLWIALGVVAATGLTDAVYVMFMSSVVQRRGFAAANWGALSYLLSSFAVISFTTNWVYVAFAALGSWIGAYLTIRYVRRPGDQAGASEASAEPAAACGAETLAAAVPGPRLAA
jgi:hypothetical protein